ncbi:MAG: sigma-54-dependent Fis family transcriptional regulator [Fidelibacterota bacterium]|nr:MAG: sigma-54-dependent Fis family transcriptional regulator [Candidatus Neomarinimicrobiota bacterium]
MKAEEFGILIVDDEFGVRDSLTRWLEKDNYRVEAAGSAKEALLKLDTGSWDIALVDLKMPGMDGIELLQRIREIDEQIAVVIITAYATVDTAVEAMKIGAYDYITKPVDPDDISRLIQKALEHQTLAKENILLKSNIQEMQEQYKLIGESPAIRKCLEMVDTVSKTDSTVLIRGESGTGKELFARAIHLASHRRFCPMITVNCGALPDTLLESELFGHEKGAFTGAQYRRKGRFELADGGTIFLDEISTISPKTQIDLLRVLETKQVTRLGASKTLKLDFRVICATNENLESLIKEGKFREDLYYRMNVFTLHVPPLRERRSDIPLLVEYFVQKYVQAMNKPVRSVTSEAMDMIVRYTWPGNVRELENVIERAMVLCKRDRIDVDDLPFGLYAQVEGDNRDSLANVERAHILRILHRTDWNITHAATMLEIDRSTLYNKIKRYQIDR